MMLSDVDAPLRILDETAIADAELRRDPYDFVYVEQAVDPKLKKDVLADAPAIHERGNYTLSQLHYGPNFDACIKDLLSVRFRRLVEQKFDMDLSRFPPCIVMMGHTTGRYNEGYAHRDSKHKIITVLLGLSESWPYERGRLRILRSNDRDDCAFECSPEFGKMLMFRVGDQSWHGFLPQKGKHMSVQLCYVDSVEYAHRENIRHAISGYFKSIPGVRQVLDWAPRSFGNKG
jgi:hypothetical protein